MMGTTKRILIVDDEPDIRDLLQMEFEESGWEVLLAQNLEEALSVSSKEKVDVILSDIRMPDGTGIQFFKTMDKKKSGNPILFFMSGYSDISEKEAKEIGVYQVFKKPMEISKLVRQISDALK